ncbi:MAG: hypothetical protein QNJ70_30735 [Xenococcaceae cyanobacterium MO_207.B15]|nr:hypothetical protein [Xenococcaceae cyanobacterium MO_207.B15]
MAVLELLVMFLKELLTPTPLSVVLITIRYLVVIAEIFLMVGMVMTLLKEIAEKTLSSVVLVTILSREIMAQIVLWEVLVMTS